MFGLKKKIYIAVSGSLCAFMDHKEIDKIRAKPLCEISSNLLELTGKKTFNWNDLVIAEKLGYKIMVVYHFEDVKFVRDIHALLRFPGI